MFFGRKKEIYLDYASTTPVLPEVLSVMRKYHTEDFHNPSSLYRSGVRMKKEFEKTKENILHAFEAQASKVVFTGSGTEANNLALLGMRNDEGRFDGMHFVTSNIEHSSVREVFGQIEKLGGEVTYLQVDEKGLIKPKDVLAAIKKNTKLISFILVHNEIGVIQDIKQISKMVRRAEKYLGIKVPIHLDACQAPNYLKIDMLRMGVQMLTVDGQKIYGPKGIGALVLKKNINLKPIIFGGKQEMGLRAGTEPISLIKGFEKALEIAERDRVRETERLTLLRDKAIEKILKEFPGSSLNGDSESRIAHNINICFPGLDAEYAVIQLDYAGICCSYASSCNSLGDTLTSLSVDVLGKKGCGGSSLRFTMGRMNCERDLDILLEKLKNIVDA